MRIYGISWSVEVFGNYCGQHQQVFFLMKSWVIFILNGLVSFWNLFGPFPMKLIQHACKFQILLIRSEDTQH